MTEEKKDERITYSRKAYEGTQIGPDGRRYPIKDESAKEAKSETPEPEKPEDDEDA